MTKITSRTKKFKTVSKNSKGRDSAMSSRKVMGVTSEGTIIFEPTLKPKTFTKTELRRAVRAVKAKRLSHAS